MKKQIKPIKLEGYDNLLKDIKSILKKLEISKKKINRNLKPYEPIWEE